MCATAKTLEEAKTWRLKAEKMETDLINYDDNKTVRECMREGITLHDETLKSGAEYDGERRNWLEKTYSVTASKRAEIFNLIKADPKRAPLLAQSTDISDFSVFAKNRVIKK